MKSFYKIIGLGILVLDNNVFVGIFFYWLSVMLSIEIFFFFDNFFIGEFNDLILFFKNLSLLLVSNNLLYGNILGFLFLL